MLHAYKARHKEKYIWKDRKDYIIEEWKHWDQERLTLYTKWLDCYKVVDYLEGKDWILLSEWESDIIMQCKKCFEFDGYFEFYKYDLENKEVLETKSYHKNKESDLFM